jgi:hypothetical protein
MSPGRLINEGIWFYEKVSPATIRIEEVEWLPGSEDYEDPPEISDARRGTFYRVSSTAPGSTHFGCIRGYFDSAEAAKRAVEVEFVGIVWRV